MTKITKGQKLHQATSTQKKQKNKTDIYIYKKITHL